MTLQLSRDLQLRDTRASFQIESNMKVSNLLLSQYVTFVSKPQEWYGIPLETSRVDLSVRICVIPFVTVLLLITIVESTVLGT